MTDDQPQIPDAHWIDTHTPEQGRAVRVQARDGFGLYALPFPVEFRDDVWFNSDTGEALDSFVAGWLPWK